MTFGERLVQLRKEKKISQKDFAAILGISPTRLNYWEKDKRFPPIPMLNKISEALNVDGDVLLGRKENSSETSFGGEKDPKLETIISNYKKLNERGKTALMEQSVVMASMPQYIDDDIKSNSLSADTVEREEVG